MTEMSVSDLGNAVPETEPTTRGRPRRRWLLGLGLVLIFVAGAYAIPWFSKRAPLKTSPGPSGWRIFHEPRFDWTLQYPDSWHAQRIKEAGKGWHHPPDSPAQYGILISNIDRRFARSKHSSTLRTPWFDMRDVPDTFIAVQVSWLYRGGTPALCEEWGSRFPLSLKNAEKSSSEIGIDPRLEDLWLRFVARHEALYSVRAWIGPRASPADRGKLDRIVASIRFENAPREQKHEPRACLS